MKEKHKKMLLDEGYAMTNIKPDIPGKRYKNFAANDAYNAQAIENGRNVWDIYSDAELDDLYHYHASKGNSLTRDIGREITRRENDEK